VDLSAAHIEFRTVVDGTKQNRVAKDK
jgi:hypothetical protein